MSKTNPADDKTAERHVPGAALLYKAFSVLDAVAKAKSPPRIGDLLQTTGIPKGTLYRVLQALVDRRFLRLEPGDQTYRLGTHLFDLAHSVWESFDLRSAAASELISLRDRSDETVRLSILDGYHVLYIDQLDAMSELRVASAVGNRVPVHASSAGKAMLAALEPVHKAEVLSRLAYEKLTDHTIDNEDDLRAHLDLVSARGFAVSVEERVLGIASVSAPILDVNNRPVGALTMTGPSFRIDTERLNALGRDLIDSARRIAGNAGMFTQPFSVSTPPKPDVPIPEEVSCVVEAKSLQGEGPLWSPDDDILYWVDILGPSLHIYNARLDRDRTIPFPSMLSAVARTQDDNLLVISQNGIQVLDLHSSKLSMFVDPEPRLSANRLNDAKVDRKGRLWVGSMAIDAAPGHGSLYRVTADGMATAMDTGFTISNGIAWSPDDLTMYFIDSGTNRVYAYEFDLESGDLGRRDVLIEIPEEEGRPGGLTVDRDGFLWLARYDGWAVMRYQPDGKPDKTIPLPVPRPTSCMFGGKDLSDLYVTSARIRLSSERISEAPLSGSVFRIATEYQGLPEPRFDRSTAPA